MKTKMALSPLFIAYAGIRKLDVDKIVQACESVLNAREEVGRESSGTRNEKKTRLAKSSETVNYVTDSNVVTAFIQYAESEVGSLDKAVAKAGKLGLVGSTLADMPATLHGFNVNEWLLKFTIESEEDKAKRLEAEKLAAQAAIAETVKQVEADKASKAKGAKLKAQADAAVKPVPALA